MSKYILGAIFAIFVIVEVFARFGYTVAQPKPMVVPVTAPELIVDIKQQIIDKMILYREAARANTKDSALIRQRLKTEIIAAGKKLPPEDITPGMRRFLDSR